MPYKHKPNSGSIFRNDKRDKETSPHMRGDALIDGVEYWVAAWTNTKADGERYQGLKFSRKDEQRQARPVQQPIAQPNQSPLDGPFNDEIPF